MSPFEASAPHLRPVEEPIPHEAEAPRRTFGVIEGGFDRAARFIRLLGSTLLVTFIVGLVGALMVHATIIENQRDLDETRQYLDGLRADTEALRHELAELEAPARIAADARSLGMIEAPSITYLQTPGNELDERTLSVAANQLRRAG